MTDKQKPDQDVVNWMNRFDSLNKPKVNESHDEKQSSSGGVIKKTPTGIIHKDSDKYGHKFNIPRTGGKNEPERVHQSHKVGSHDDPRISAKLSRITTSEATGDSKFDSMMGKIGSNTEPQSFDANRAERTGQRASRPDPELINSLNNIMYTMHKSMKEFEDLMAKLQRGQ